MLNKAIKALENQNQQASSPRVSRHGLEKSGEDSTLSETDGSRKSNVAFATSQNPTSERGGVVRGQKYIHGNCGAAETPSFVADNDSQVSSLRGITKLNKASPSMCVSHTEGYSCKTWSLDFPWSRELKVCNMLFVKRRIST